MVEDLKDMTRPLGLPGLPTPPTELAVPDLTGCETVMPLTEHVAKALEDPDGCARCDLSVITPWYSDLLKEQGYTTEAQQIDDVVGQEGEETDVVKLAETLDAIKESVDNEDVRGTLTLYDCMMQSYKEEPEGGPDG